MWRAQAQQRPTVARSLLFGLEFRVLKTLLWRFAIPTFVAIAAAAWIAAPHVESILTEWFGTDIALRARLVMSSIEDPLAELVEKHSPTRLKQFLSKVTADERLLGVLVCRPDGKPIFATEAVPAQVSCALAVGDQGPANQIIHTPKGSVHVARFDSATSGGPPFRTLIVHDLSFVDRRQIKARDYLVAFAIVSAVGLLLLSVAAAWLLLRSWASALIVDIRGRRFLDDSTSHRSSLPILSQVRQVLREIEQNQRLEIEYRENWTPQALQHVVRELLESPQVVVVSNREPYIHDVGVDGRPIVRVPASGMVTALEPVIRACEGVWVAHGSGAADRDVVDAHDQIRVPPGDPAYTLRRVWLTAEEEQGYYYGFANEGLWPLCHLAYVRPAFREQDWLQYRTVNQKFADVVSKESRSDRPLVFVQDYHFALLPALLRDRIPGATIAAFWHIPWPNAETFGVCPYKEELLHGLLSADILGFHTRYHCQNFLATVERFIECQVDTELMTVSVQGHACHVAPYPISIAWPPGGLENLPPAHVCRREVVRRFGLDESVRIGVGVERWDFTKGIVERFLALERFLDQYPKWCRRVTLLQVAAPTRSRLPVYEALQHETQDTARRINERFGDDQWRPIVLIGEHQAPPQVFELYRAADFCLVNSLHDGMNLVAKEFVAARDDEDGALILSTFAGASRELVEALLVNPYDIVGTSEAILAALEMPREERRKRMQLMRRTVKENNVYRWAGRILTDAARVRQREQLRLQASAHADESLSTPKIVRIR